MFKKRRILQNQDSHTSNTLDNQAACPDAITGVQVGSEVGRLRRVFVHTPGSEVESMTPRSAQELLYNDIIQFQQVQRGHAQLKGVLSLVADTLEVKTCLSEVLLIPEARDWLLTEVTRFSNCPELLPELKLLPATECADLLIAGVPLKRDSLTSWLSERTYSIVPLPNMYFMRDTSLSVGNSHVIAAMATGVRFAESLIMKAIYKWHPKFLCKDPLIDGMQFTSKEHSQFRIEGGDIQIVRENILMCGISERTSVQALDALIENYWQARKLEGKEDPGFTLFAVTLPQERSTIHLDMVFTFASPEQAVIYEPYILGRDRKKVVKVTVNKLGQKSFENVTNIIEGLKTVGVNIDPIFCGGQDPLHQQREQWNSGANLFAFAPGKVISYAMHQHTVKAMEEAGFRAIHAKDVLKTPEVLNSNDNQVILLDGEELARGGGGPRCMTCPVFRDRL